MEPEIRPLQTLRTLTTEIEAAITLLRAAPDKKPVHRFRTATRRIEAQLHLIDLLPGLPVHKAASRKLARLLRTLRRAAGKVRDLDVQRDMLKQLLPQRKGSHLMSSAEDLRRLLKHRRTVATDELLHTLKRKGPTLATHLEALLTDLGNADPALSPDDLHDLIVKWHHERSAAALQPQSAAAPSLDEDEGSDGSATQEPAPAVYNPARLTTDQLHTARKLAKLARYLAESATAAGQPDTHPTPPLANLAHHLHSIQKAGGDWHDALILARRARKDLGRHDPLTKILLHDRDRLLLSFQEQLSDQQS